MSQGMTDESAEYGHWYWEYSYWLDGWQSGWRREKWYWHSGFLTAHHALENLNCKPWSWCYGWPVERGEWAWDWNHGLKRAQAHACTPIVQTALESYRKNNAEPSHAFRNGSQVRLLDIAVLHGDSVSVRALVERCGPCRILRLWTWRELVIDLRFQLWRWPGAFTELAGGEGPAVDAELRVSGHRLREPRIFEAAVNAGLDFSCLNGASERSTVRINVLDVAVLSGERNIVDLLRRRSMEPEFFSNPEELDFAGMHFVELWEQGLTLRMPSISAAADAGINLNMLAMNLDSTLGPGCNQCLQCWEEDGMLCLLKRESDDDIDITISLLDAALMLGKATDACNLVSLGVNMTRLKPEDLCHPAPCVFKCSNPTCGAEWPAPIFAPPQERQAATVAAIRCSLRLQLRCSWDRYAPTLLQMLGRSASVAVARILTFLVDAPPIARLGIWHLLVGWDSR